jgi:hypothetical protein
MEPLSSTIRSAYSVDQTRGGEAFREGDPNNRATSSLDNVSSDDVVGPPVSTFHQDIRLDDGNQGVRCVLVEDSDGVDAAEGREEFGALAFWCDRASRSFVGAHRAVGVDTHDQDIAKRTGIAEVSDVARVEQVEHTVREHNTPAAGADVGRER